MTRHGGGDFSGGGGGGGGGGFGSHGRSGGGSFGPPPPPPHHHPPPPRPPHHHPTPPHFHPPPPHLHRRPLPIFYNSPPIIYSAGPRLAEPMYQTVPQPDVVPLPRNSRREQLLNRTKGIFTFLMIASLIGTVWLYFGIYESTVIELGVHDSRLLTARPFFIDSIKFKNKYETEGPLLYTFDYKPPLNQESSWLDSQNTTFQKGHREFYYWLNKGSTITVDYVLEVRKKLESVYLAMIKDTEDSLKAYHDKPSGVTKPLHGHDVLKYDVKEDADYAFSLVTYNPEDVTVYLDFHFHTREYSTAGAIHKNSLKTDSNMNLSLFRSRYGLLVGPGYDKMGVDIWEIELSYGTRWTIIIFFYGLLALAYFVTKSTIMVSTQEPDVFAPEYAPLVQPQETQTEAIVPALAPAAPTAPILPGAIPEEASTKLKEKEKDSEKDVPEDKLCSVCLDAPKDCFFVPCGHRATCYACGLRISQLDPANCPICRQPIGEVKRIYDV